MTWLTTLFSGIVLTIGGWLGITPEPQFSALPVMQYEQGGTGTSTAPVSQLLYGGSGKRYQSVATTTLGATSPLALTGTTVIVGDTARTISIDTTGTWTGNAGTASALAADPANCSSGSAPLGIVASGAVEGCFDVWSEAENTAAGYLAGYDAFTHPASGQSATTSLMLFSGQASSTQLSAYQAYFGATATTTFLADGSVGVSSSTPWGQLSIASTTFNGDGYSPVFAVSTSSTPFGFLMGVFATSTTLSNTSTLVNLLKEVGVRIGIGTHTYLGGPILDHLLVRGRFNTAGMNMAWCDQPVGLTAISADGIAGCGGYSFAEDGTATLTAVDGNGYGYGQLATTIANDGAGVWLTAPGAGFLRAATSTPVIEVTARINTVQNATTTNFFIGFSNVVTNGTAIDTLPTAGCFFTASSTQANWRAVCRTALATGTYEDTTVASSSVITGTGAFNRFRIELDSERAKFYIQMQNGELVRTNTITHSLTTQALNAGVHYTRTQGVAAVNFDFMHLRTWWRDFVPAR